MDNIAESSYQEKDENKKNIASYSIENISDFEDLLSQLNVLLEKVSNFQPMLKLIPPADESHQEDSLNSQSQKGSY